MTFRPHACAWLASAALAACAAPDAPAPEPVDEAARAGVALNGVSTNGVALNGVSTNGVALNGVALNGVSTNGVALNGVSTNGVALNGSELTAVAADGAPLAGAQLVGAEFQGQLSSGAALPLRVDAARAAGDVWFYQVSYATTAGRRPLCGADAAGNAVEALALAGRWDYRQGVPGGGAFLADPAAFTFACRGASLAKCVELGYEPWATAADGSSRRDHHQACTRLLRADYCGDGRSFTVDGTPVNLYDGAGVQADAEAWPFEAEWTPDGARFVSVSAEQRFRRVVGLPPLCFLLKVSLFAGAPAHFDAGTLLMSENKPELLPILGL